MKQKLRKGISVLLAAVFVFSGVLLLWQLHDYRAADRLHSAARELAASSVPQSALPVVPEPTVESPSAEELDLPEEPVPMVPDPGIQPEKESLAGDVRFLMDLDLEALRQTNRRVLGWICIPDSPVDYPLLQVDSNSEYLRRAWDGTPNRAGCIFLECRNSADFSDFNTIIYGHYMRNAAMFGSLHDYGSQEYRDAHPYIYIATDERVLCYEVFAAYEADVVGLLVSATEPYTLFPPNITCMVNREVIGIVSKINDPKANVQLAELWLQNAGCKTIFFVDSVTGEGVDKILEHLNTPKTKKPQK